MSNRKYEFGVGILLIVAAAATGVMAIYLGASSFVGDHVEVTVQMADAAGVEVGAVVSIAGVEVGTVRGLALEGHQAKASLSLDPEAKVRANAIPRVRMRSLLGEKYVELVPQQGDAPLLKDGDALPPAQSQIEIDEMISALGPLLESIDGEVLGDVLSHLADALEKDPERLARILENVDAMAGDAAQASASLPGLMTETRGAIRDAKGAVAQFDARARETKSLLENADAVVTQVGQATEPLPEIAAQVQQSVNKLEQALDPMGVAAEDLAKVLDVLANMDEQEVRRILLEDGVRVRLFEQKGRVKRRSTD